MRLPRRSTTPLKRRRACFDVETPGEALRLARRIATELKRLSGDAKLSRLIELSGWSQKLTQHIETLRAEMSAVGDDVARARASADACQAYHTTNARRRR